MSSTIKNIIILVVIAIILFLGYFFFFNGAPQQGSLTSTTGTSSAGVTNTTGANSSAVGAEFLTVLLNVKTIKLDDSIFSDPAFASLHDSSIQLVSDGTEGRTNPFAPIGSDITAAPINALNPTSPTFLTPITNPIIPTTTIPKTTP